MNRNRLLLLGGAVVVAAIVAVVLIFTVGGSGRRTTTAAPPATLAGIPQHGDTLGSPTASVTLTVFEDPQCPFCRQWNVDTLSTVVNEFVRPGRIKLVYRGINIIGPNSDKGLRAIYAAAEQNKLWEFVDGLYARQGQENSGWITDGVIRAVAGEAHANGSAVLSASSSAAVTKMLKTAERDAIAVSLRGTPTFIVTRPLSQPQQLAAPLDPSGFVAALTAMLQ